MSQAEAIANQIGGAKREGRHWRVNCVCCDGRQKLALADGSAGLLVKCWRGCDPIDILKELRARGWLEGQSPSDRPMVRQARQRPGPSDPDPMALAIWDASVPAGATLAAEYLANRGIDATALPPAIRFHPSLNYYESYRLPALVAGLQNSHGQFVAVQYLLLGADGHKAKVFRPRTNRGAMGDGSVRLGEPNAALGIAEGVETGLSAQMLFDVPVWCALGASRMQNVWIPPFIETLHIFADNGAAGEAAAQQTIKANSRIRCVIHRPRVGSDWNDALMTIRNSGAA